MKTSDLPLPTRIPFHAVAASTTINPVITFTTIVYSTITFTTTFAYNYRLFHHHPSSSPSAQPLPTIIAYFTITTIHPITTTITHNTTTPIITSSPTINHLLPSTLAECPIPSPSHTLIIITTTTPITTIITTPILTKTTTTPSPTITPLLSPQPPFPPTTTPSSPPRTALLTTIKYYKRVKECAQP
ncbi:platelet glycoprotein Ib alpha chain-like [Penaeus vannamei]|uniref:platelet glycoprotein Ib alpha chain-like n=1 Tax=Penaeus vannamei TaxID=6689 RepID=UPI00387F8754